MVNFVAPPSWEAHYELQAKAIRERDIVFCESLIACLGRGIITTYQMADILGEFNKRRPDKPEDEKDGQARPKSIA
jgi:hypothetical protein